MGREDAIKMHNQRRSEMLMNMALRAIQKAEMLAPADDPVKEQIMGAKASLEQLVVANKAARKELSIKEL